MRMWPSVIANAVFAANDMLLCKVRILTFFGSIGHFTVVYLVTWPWIESEAEGDLVLIQTSVVFICKCTTASIRTA